VVVVAKGNPIINRVAFERQEVVTLSRKAARRGALYSPVRVDASAFSTFTVSRILRHSG
jgi:hypothetical protein